MPASPEHQSFRDPAGSLSVSSTRVVRQVLRSFAEDLVVFSETEVAKRLESEGSLVSITRLPESGDTHLLFEHERIEFPVYPYELPAEMLHAAASLTLDLVERLLPMGFGLKDGTPYNVLFRGSAPVFVDWGSFERRDPGDPVWLPYAQFVRTFLLPLACEQHNIASAREILLSYRDGMEPERLYPRLSLLRRLRSPFLTLVSFPHWLSSRSSHNLYQPRRIDPEKARFILSRVLSGLRRHLGALAPAPGRVSTWSHYTTTASHYSDQQAHQKEEFVRSAVDELRPARVLDVGANTGHFSRIAASAGAGSVVSLDSDPVATGAGFSAARAGNLPILPLVGDFARPTPATGWRNRECASFLDRATSHFDLVLMLAVLHHLIVTERIPLDEILSLVAQLTRRHAVIEFIAPGDPMFRTILRGRDALHQDWNQAAFESACNRYFRVLRSQTAPGGQRVLYLLEKS